MPQLLLINGPNLNLLGNREPGVYGSRTLDDIVDEVQRHAASLGLDLVHFQSNHEGELVTRVQQASREGVSYIVINPAAYTHTSIALRDALLASDIPFIEVHLSNIHARESFRRHSYLSDIASGVIVGFGPSGYRLAIDAAASALGMPRST
ncbi:type II 3-dehydroquinate dehydratase [Acidihalobacter aeolianus]|uniref:3-dehydroquinate dehydratase n=1 Tax=Acidihalobacter aeolianus TaxID=2792603 RepID=A0A1D8K5C3_9GAMM|nr:type II 3-dehydroquinate dehydratase [Acidihalobacter aeolianus]AOV16161.1 type II 3-dehydroquinate dehydratase [Acidihalobacter aeolianus]